MSTAVEGPSQKAPQEAAVFRRQRNADAAGMSADEADVA
jgi:hypothetical protein